MVAPSRIAHLAPRIELGRVASHPEHAVDIGGAAEHAATREEQRAPIQAAFGLGLKAPQRALTDENLRHADGNADPRPAIVLSRLQQQHAVAARLGEPRRQRAARGAGADDDEIDRGFGHDCTCASRGLANPVGRLHQFNFSSTFCANAFQYACSCSTRLRTCSGLASPSGVMPSLTITACTSGN